jgi:hypothetical protein
LRLAKKLVDVEDLMVWAAAELARKRPPGAVSAPALDVSRGDRELVGKWDRPMGYAPMSPMFSAGLARAGCARGDPPHPDALVIEQALERAKLAPPAPMIDADDLAHGLGFALDTAGPMRKALGNSATLMVVHGRLSKRPSLGFEPMQPTARRAANGKPGVWRLESWSEPTFDDHAHAYRTVEAACGPKRKDAYPSGAYGVLDWAPDPQSRVEERAAYAGWLAGLFWMVEALSGRLESRAALAPRAALRPWMGERDGAAVHDLYGPGADRVYSRGEAATVAAERNFGRRRAVQGGAVYVGVGDDGDAGVWEA